MTLGILFWSVIIVGVVYLLMKKGGGGGCCGGHDHGGHTQHAHGESDHPVDQGENMVAQHDPVCGMTVGITAISRGYEGQKYYFCSPKCLKTFDSDPEKFIKTTS